SSDLSRGTEISMQLIATCFADETMLVSTSFFGPPTAGAALIGVLRINPRSLPCRRCPPCSGQTAPTCIFLERSVGLGVAAAKVVSLSATEKYLAFAVCHR